jgi:uncharacterized protein involved in exopolysaccharide biosynthesis
MRHEATSNMPKRAGSPVDLHWVVLVLRRGFRVLGLALIWGLVLAMILALLVVPSEWESEALLVADQNEPSQGPVPFERLSEGAQLIKHQRTLEEVRTRLSIPGSVDALARRIDAEADRAAGVIRLRVRSSSAEGAAGLAEVVVDTFLAQRRSSEADRLREHARSRRAELRAAEEQLVDARGEYDRFRNEHGISDLDAERERAISEAARLTAEADEEEVAALTAEVRMNALRAEARRLPRMHTASATSTDVVQGDLAEARAQLAQARARYTAEHPAVQALVARVESLEQARRTGGRNTVRTDATSAVNPIREELEGNVAMAAADRATSRERTTGLRRLAERAQERVRTLSEIEGQATLLLAAVNVGVHQVEELGRSIAEAEDRAADPPAGYHVTAAAVPPEAPLSSKARKLAWVLPPLLSVLMAFAFLFFRERGGARARSAMEIAWWGNAPVIGTTTWPRDPLALDLLVAELEDLGTYAAGRTLVVPATEEERGLAMEFAARLAEAPWLAAGVLDVDEAPRSETPPRVAHADLRAPVHRPTLPMPIVVPPPSNVRPSGDADGATKIRRATVRVMTADSEASAIVPSGGSRAESFPGESSRRMTGRFTMSAPTVLVGRDVRVGNIVRVGDSPVVNASAVMLTPPPEPNAEQRTIQVSGTVSDGTGASVPFEVRAEAPRKQDAVLMLAMRILGDVGDSDPEAERATILDTHTPRHRAIDPSESRGRYEQAVALAWNGPLVGPTLRRAARLADRVIVLVRDATLTPADLTNLQVRLGREDAIGFLIVGVDGEEANRRDRVGQVAEFWTSRKRLPG